MEESFRRAIRKMTGKSLKRFFIRENKSELEATLSQTMSVNFAIALFEHLDAVLNLPEAETGKENTISFSETAWKTAAAEFPKIIEESKLKFEEFRHKWKERFTTEELLRILLQGNWITEENALYSLTIKNTKTEINNLYLATIHLMVGDAEKLFVMLTSKVIYLQNRLCKHWYEESAVDAISKILPCLEASLRKQEETLVASLRATIAFLAKERFAMAFSSKAKQKKYTSAYACVRRIGNLWNSTGAYENAFLAFLDDFCDYVSGLSLLLEEWYFNKWSLFLRGFSRGQLDLFATLQKQD